MKLRIDIDCIFLDKRLSSSIVTLRLDSLDLCKKVAEENAESLIVIPDEICLSGTDLLLDHIVCKTLLIAPVCDELTVLHMCLHVLLAQSHTCELCEDTVADVA